MTRIREEAIRKVTGQAKYTSDLYLPGMAYAKLLASPYASAKIVSIDTKEAEALPGVVAIVTAADLKDLNMYVGDVVSHEPIIAADKVCYQGEVVAAIAAVDLTTVEEAMDLIQVEYEPLRPVANIDAALAPGAPLVHERIRNLGQSDAGTSPLPLVTANVDDEDDYMDTLIDGSNQYHHVSYKVGDIDKGLAEAEKIFEDEYYIPPICSYPMEPAACLATSDSEGITIWPCSQGPFGVQEKVAHVFKVPFARVRAIGSYIGTGFGGRGGHEDVISVALTLKAGVPIKLLSDFSQDAVVDRRVAFRTRLKTGVRKDGTISASQLTTWADGGAYARRVPWIAEMGLARFLAGYRMPNVKLDAYSVFTNTSSAITYRSPGATQLGWAREAHYNRICQEMSIDPVQFRYKNLLNRGEEPPLIGARPQDSDLPGDLLKLAEASDWDKPLAPGRGRGVATVCQAASASPPGSAMTRLRSDGTLVVLCSGVEMGQGLHTAMRQIASWELGIPKEDIYVNPIVDTSVSPYDRGTGGSRGTTITGLAVQMATRDVKEQLLEIASVMFNVPVESVQIKDGKVLSGEKVYTVSEVVKEHFTPSVIQKASPGIVSMRSGVSRSAHPQGRGEILGRGSITPGFDNRRLELKPTFWETGMVVAEVEVDRDTGLVKLMKCVSLDDPGITFDEQTATGQVEGATIQGLGHTLGEEMRYDEEGQLLNSSLMEYRPVMMADIADDFRTILVENQDGPGAFGSRGMGQVHTGAIAPTVASALAQLTGVYICDLPLTPSKVWEALQKAGKTETT